MVGLAPENVVPGHARFGETQHWRRHRPPTHALGWRFGIRPVNRGRLRPLSRVLRILRVLCLLRMLRLLLLMLVLMLHYRRLGRGLAGRYLAVRCRARPRRGLS